MRKFILSFAAVAMSISGCATGQAAQSAEVAPAEVTTAEVTTKGPTTTASAAPATAPESAESCPLPAQGTMSKGETASAAPLIAPGMAKVGDRTSCPVSHETFVVKADSPKAEYNGKTYYFCCGHCVAKFEANPAKFAQAE